jgi:hypothetical protein
LHSFGLNRHDAYGWKAGLPIVANAVPITRSVAVLSGMIASIFPASSAHFFALFRHFRRCLLLMRTPAINEIIPPIQDMGLSSALIGK